MISWRFWWVTNHHNLQDFGWRYLGGRPGEGQDRAAHKTHCCPTQMKRSQNWQVTKIKERWICQILNLLGFRIRGLVCTARGRFSRELWRTRPFQIVSIVSSEPFQIVSNKTLSNSSSLTICGQIWNKANILHIKAAKLCLMSFLAVQNSSIGDLVTQSVSQLVTDWGLYWLTCREWPQRLLTLETSYQSDEET